MIDIQIYHGESSQDNIVQGSFYRFTVLTDRLMRLEFDKNGIFEDRPSQFAINRDFDTPNFTVFESKDSLEIHTKYLSLYYNKDAFTSGGLSIKVRSPCRGIYSTWHYQDVLTENLGGTVRTLDQADGPIPLEVGIQSRLQGYSIINDSCSLLFTENGWISSRREDTIDLYFFGYGYAYRECLQDYFRLSGRTPLLPRFVFGNWWSRFFAYSDVSYIELMKRFQEENIPLSVAVLDMNWHITDISPGEGKGWTGFTWNNDLFPQPDAFIEKIHDMGLKLTLNLHPAEGIQPYEKAFVEAAVALNRNPDKRFPISFDFCDQDFIKTYFEKLIQPLEKDGVDFWWIDWQQGKTARMPGADPLWLLNHFHFLHSGNAKKRPLIFSRYAGPGSHRYPVGFSGDTVISWASLNFQPFLTATAANIGFGWWSHDIGGHCGGRKDEELMTRWVQFGVFSPIMRLHSTSNLFNGKEPWKFSEPASSIIKRFLRLRHQLIPYLYTANWHCYKDNTLLIEPMYYQYPDRDEAYEVPNQYIFGSQLLVCPITSPADTKIGLGSVTAWLPERLYFDIFTGMCYHGNRKLKMFRTLEEMPVLAPAGAIIPLTEEHEAEANGTNLPVHMELRVFNGMSGCFELYEDDGYSNTYQAGSYSITKYSFDFPNAIFTIQPDKNASLVCPKNRQYSLCFYGFTKEIEGIEAYEGKTLLDYRKYYDHKKNILKIELPPTKSRETLQIVFHTALTLAHKNTERRIFELLENMKIEYELKEQIYRCITKSKNPIYAICELQTMNLLPDVINAISEILFAE